jgi:hypothetical protein
MFPFLVLRDEVRADDAGVNSDTHTPPALVLLFVPELFSLSEKLESELLHLVPEQSVFGGIGGLWVLVVDAKLEYWQLQTFWDEQMSLPIAAIHADVDGTSFEVHGYQPNFSSQSSWQHSQRNTDLSGWLRLAATMWRCSPSMIL